MKPIKSTFRLTEKDTVQIIHLGSRNPVTVWITDALFTTGAHCIVMANGRTHKDGYLPIKVKINGKLAYPRKKLSCLVSNMSVTLEFNNVILDNVSESFMCEERDIDRVRYSRYRKSMEMSISEKSKERYRALMAEIKAKWEGRP